ncbi:MAG: hypothetical protein EA427_09815 [Spirochaetaceae bacterium]|nr:MAG: hypothetical protein EA427_09815 [Spirochaetaceae bacterium]
MLAAGVLGTFSLALRVVRLQRAVTALSAGISTEMERQNELTQYLESNQRAATDQLKEVRRLLNLPVAEFRFPGEAAARQEKPEGEQLFFRALDRLVLHHEQRELREELATFFSDRGAAHPLLRDQGLEARQGDRPGTWAITFRNPRTDRAPLFTLRVTGSAPPAVLEVQPLGAGPQRLAYRYDREDFPPRLAELLRDTTPDVLEYIGRYETARESLLQAGDSREVQHALARYNLQIAGDHDAYPLVLTVHSPDGERLLAAEVIPERTGFRVGEETLPLEESSRLGDLLARKIADLDPRPEEHRAEEEALDQVLRIARDRTFREHLEARGLRIATEPRETLDFRLLELTDSAGDPLGSFAVLKSNGEIYLLDEEDVMITSLRTLRDDRIQLDTQRISSTEEARTLPESFPPGFRRGSAGEGTDLLLVGTHENKADAIMLLHLSPDRTISLISIPRDIYYQGRKLSYHFEIYGASTFMRRISNIIDRPIEGYVEIDMYAFIEVVNILGGITLTLDEPLTDTTYLVRDDGQWGTLHYPAGTHTLNGIEALRIARSRATTTDFGRSSRQQDILESLRRRINDLHAGNLDQLYQLFRALFEYVDTDMSAWELTQYFLAYRNAPILNRTGLTFDNVLYATWSNIHNRGITFEEAEEMEDFFFGQWILLPRGDDWSVIPWFVEDALGAGTGTKTR